MTREDAAMLIRVLVLAYPSQVRPADFQTALADYMVQSRVPGKVMAERISEWIKTERFWPAISDLVYPCPPAPTLLLQPARPIDTVDGIAILKEAYENIRLS